MKFAKLLNSFLLLVLISMMGCQEYGEIKVFQKNEALFFGFENMSGGGQDKNEYILYSISVNKEDCASNCISWEMTRDVALYDSLEHPLPGSAIEYGINQEAMHNQAKPEKLMAGSYRVIANVALLKDGKIVKTDVLTRKFTLVSQGKRLVLRN